MSTNVNIEKYVAPARELTNLAVANFEKLFAIQIKTAETYVNAGVDSLKGVVAVKDVESLKTYLEDQSTANRKLVEATVAESKKIVEIGQTYASEVKGIVEGSLAIN